MKTEPLLALREAATRVPMPPAVAGATMPPLLTVTDPPVRPVVAYVPAALERMPLALTAVLLTIVLLVSAVWPRTSVPRSIVVAPE